MAQITPPNLYITYMRDNKRGYWGIAFFEPKTVENIGTAIRSAHCFGSDFLAVIGKRYKRTPADTMASERHIPIYEYTDLDDFKAHIPLGCDVFVVEMGGIDVRGVVHPERCIYLLGGEDRTVPEVKGWPRITFPTSHCINMAMAATLISYDRIAKSNERPATK